MSLMLHCENSGGKTSEADNTSSSSQGRIILEAVSKASQQCQQAEGTGGRDDLRDRADASQAEEPGDDDRRPDNACRNAEMNERRRPSNKSRARYRRIVDEAEHMNDFTYLCHVLVGDPTPSRMYLKRMAEARFGDRAREAFAQAGLTFTGWDGADVVSSSGKSRISL
eukprot:TRINITY_DN10213_c0_g1_i3.p1 TRINITY_DN10213_c0_g1~~TRINITY_DN10213_c0_g1_i3.p1  ORF type:complete len:187 (-),score=25.47 TRINITY_DN10213_c0_g1_i3:287-790(-)